MSIESIIGIISGVIAIIGAIISSIHFLRKKFKECPTTDLFDQLTSKELSDVTRRKILQKLNKSSLISNRIKEEYIQTFALEKRGRETVLFDICDSNDIEPTDDVCKGLIGAFMPSLRKRYQEKRQNQKELLSEAPVSIMDLMENDKTPNHHGEQTVYMSELLKTKYPETCERLIKILDKYNVKYSFLKGTKDIWCRDYMPIQTESGKFIQFNYDPSYLKGNKEWEESRSDVKEVCRINNVNAQFSNIIIDGGNVLICDGRGILSDRIFSENPNWGREELVSELSKLLECEIIIIPAQKGDMTGHADGMVRFVNKNTILGNSLDAEYKYWREGMLKVIEQYNLKYIDVPFLTDIKDPKHPYSAIGIYVNYLEVDNLIVLPVFGRDEDKQVADIIKGAFPDKVLETIDYNEVAQEGGLLNCTTWVIKA
ncbi:MAG: agmatine deiminase family protein [Prevotella sp.]|nr:agmatine deiminase family protein [Prevotella sp.]